MTKITEVFPETVPGIIIAWPSSNSVPDDKMFLECNGSIVLYSKRYYTIYSILQNMYGGTPGVSFGLPDLRGRYIKGAPTYVGINVKNNSSVGNHTHTASWAPLASQYVSINNAGFDYALGAVVYNKVIANTGVPLGVTVGADSIPKTMCIKYYIAY